MIVIVTGSRDWSARRPIEARLWALARTLAVTDHGHVVRWTGKLIVRHGACPPRRDSTPGADQIAHEWALRHAEAGRPVVPEPMPAEWDRFGAAAGPIRNAAMVGLGADVCLGWINPCRRVGPCRDAAGRIRPDGHGSHGATDCALLAVAAGIETHAWPGRR